MPPTRSKAFYSRVGTRNRSTLRLTVEISSWTLGAAPTYFAASTINLKFWQNGYAADPYSVLREFNPRRLHHYSTSALTGGTRVCCWRGIFTPALANDFKLGGVI